MQAPWRNLKGPARTLAVSSTILLIASGLLAIEAGVMLILGPARDIVVRPFILLGYVEACAIFFSLIFVIAAIIGLIFYRPYLYVREKLLMRAADKTQERYTYLETASPPPHRNLEEDGSPD